MTRFTWLLIPLLCSCSEEPPPKGPGSQTGGERNPTCEAGQSVGEVQEPVFVKNLPGETSWFAAPAIADLDGDGHNELVAAYYSIFVYDAQLELLHKAEHGSGRVYAPHVVADLDADGRLEVVAGNGSELLAYDWDGNALVMRDGFPVDTTQNDSQPEIRGLAAADLDGDGRVELAVTTTQTLKTSSGGSQVFVFDAEGHSFQPTGGHQPAWPRYNALPGEGNDAERNGQGHSGYGCYGLNVGIGNIDDDASLEILATYDNHHIQAFKLDGVAIDASPWFSNRSSEYAGEALTWGQFIRWAEPSVEEAHYHLHEGEWPHPSAQEWLQWTASPPSVADLDGDGRNEVIGVPNVELHEPYETQAYAVMVLEGAYGDGSRSAMRKPGWETLPRGGKPIQVDGWYPPGGIPAPVLVNLQGDQALELLVSLNDGGLYAYQSSGALLWRFDYRGGRPIRYASEPTVADLNQDGSPEVLFVTFGAPDDSSSGRLFILAADGALLHELALPSPGHNGNGNGAPAAATVGDLDGDGELEIFVQTFDHGMDVFRVPGSGSTCVLWGTARGGPRRTGQAHD
ncbi:MAG: VCBS repeat-containing protein [Myxococcota bacterium]|jgi:hypothetical protein|nr:VCBS repeat-containing protein [Myxococcota bacterium]